MKTLKTTPQKRWYRIKDGIVYDILTSKPSDKLTNDYYSYEQLNLPRIGVTYVEENISTDSAIQHIEIYYYLDVYIDKGDTFDGRMFKPYINNTDEGDSDISYVSIHEYGIKKMITNNILNNVPREITIENIPLYHQFRRSQQGFTPQKIVHNGKTYKVSCIDRIEVYGTEGLNTSTGVTDFVSMYDFYAIEIINKYIYDLTFNLINKQNIDLNQIIINENLERTKYIVYDSNIIPRVTTES